MTRSPKISVCIPAYNRVEHLPPLLDSILAQDYHDFEVVICEDHSRQRIQIAAVVEGYQNKYPALLRYYEHQDNRGYDATIRSLVANAQGEFCFFMGNDDLMCPNALSTVAGILSRYDNIGMILKSYAWFDRDPATINQEVRYLRDEYVLRAGKEAISVCYRRSGVIAGYIVHRAAANDASTDRFDGTLYYQMHLTATILINRCAVVTPKLLVLCRNSEPPEFGSSISERGKYTPGGYSPEARLNMVAGAVAILKDLKETRGMDVVEPVMRDYAAYFFPYVRDQLSLPWRRFYRLYRSLGALGFNKYCLFHVNVIGAYIVGDRRIDAIARIVRRSLGRTPHMGVLRAHSWR